ncbi:hypothetical protein J2T38_001962 [Neisseria perflava]|uniref:hypothetical protein n=1 Tax=Neisseria perflava TaxID=33053 RepID=UPI0020A20816|nr:hypothetical protein [Neisseria perflava]MCP1773114.1 hypothetical protein [Neisseria perflava]
MADIGHDGLLAVKNKGNASIKAPPENNNQKGRLKSANAQSQIIATLFQTAFGMKKHPDIERESI